ncbi:DUF4350 domain-containing protein [Mycolicibacterium goodii]|uniref:DUF4350 domain-containing protein n=2 Tax=Mycolicibacterium goodii TaxID=134601 RepID=A0ABS6HNZ5_MYCGD|nr:DUF4350 domain-containing protein [Mycolicibacterium goodii]MBU8837540.1 DUF4350 domain-containing protein [Mycolicibacterium goodii]
MDAGAMKIRNLRWIVPAVVVIVALAVLTVHLTAPRPGGRMDPDSTSPEGARALVTLLRDHGVEVVTAADVDGVERNARPGTLLVAAQTLFLSGDEQLDRLSRLPGDLLLVEPVTKTREKLAPAVRLDEATSFGGGEPDCELPEARRAGETQLGLSNTFRAAGDVPVERCYDGAVVRYRDGNRTITVVGTAEFLSNAGLLKAGNAALAMNLAGDRARVIWYAPQEFEGTSTGDRKLSDLIPDQVRWIVLQLCLVVALLAVWQARRLGPLVAESLPVVVRASETVEGRGKLYRSHRARDRAADALRTATLQRLLPRLGLTAEADPAAVATAVASRSGQDSHAVGYALFGPPPATDADLVHLAHQLDDIERQVAHS